VDIDGSDLHTVLVRLDDGCGGSVEVGDVGCFLLVCNDDDVIDVDGDCVLQAGRLEKTL
jgi:hypothetical protein